MGEHYKAVEKILGRTFLEVLMNSVKRKEVSMDQMETLAENLGGKSFHWVRKEEGAENNVEEMMAILSDWEQFGDLKDLKGADAIQKLIELLRSSAVGLTLLADRLARYVSIADQDVDRTLIQGIIKPDEPGLCSYITRCKLSALIFSEYAENLAYEVNADFGNEFKTWQSEDRSRNKGSKVKVRKNVSKDKSKHYLCLAGSSMGSDVAFSSRGGGHSGCYH